MKKVVIFTGGEFTPPESARKYFSKIKPDYIIAADSGLETLRAYQKYFCAENECFSNFSPNLILGDFDSIKDKEILKEYDEKIIRTSPAYKDFTDTELALDYARKSFDQTFITLVGGAGGRADHFLGIYDLFGTKISPDAWLCGEEILLNASRKKILISGVTPGEPISVARASRNYRGGYVKSKGLEWESGFFRKRGMPSISNTISGKYFEEDRPIEMNFKRGNFVLILPVTAEFSFGI